MAEKPIVIALAGNPNSGKTSLFNFITGSRQHVGNYPGVTVEKKEGTVPVDDAMVNFIDLPGTYSLTPYSLEEAVARREMMSPGISAVIAVIDSTRLERNLYFVAQILEIGKPVVIALNMWDELAASRAELDTVQLSRILGAPCIPTVGNRGKGVTELMSTALKAARGEIPATGKPPVYSHEMEHAIERVEGLLDNASPVNRRWAAINLLMYGRDFCRGIDEITCDAGFFSQVDAIRERLKELEGRPVRNIATAGRYGFASGATAECLKTREHPPETVSDRIDAVLTHRFWGFPIFVAVLWLMFQGTFALGEIPMELLGLGFEQLGMIAADFLPPGFLRSLVVDGIIAGVGGVIVFLPNIMLLFFFISILEDTGYMARAAFIMDRVMHLFGMHGKVFLPMLIGFGCTVPAIMATRILENRRDRLVTMFIVPFMSCGARLPVYILLAGAFFSPANAGNVVFSVYIAGVILSLLTARVVNITRGASTPFVMELPPYRIPTLRAVGLHIWERSWMYLRKAGTLILGASVIIWILMTFPHPGESLETTHETGVSQRMQLEYSFAGRFGKIIEPALEPLGFDWRIGVALTAGFAAKEVIVSTLGTVYSIGEEHDDLTTGLKEELRSDPMFTPVKAYGLMLFILIYVPCVATLGVLRREAGSWKWVALMAGYTVTLAWVVSFVFIRGAELFL